MRIEVKQGARGKWRWMLRGVDGKVCAVALVNHWHSTPDAAEGEARMALRDVAFALCGSSFFPARRLRRIEREALKVPRTVVPRPE